MGQRLLCGHGDRNSKGPQVNSKGETLILVFSVTALGMWGQYYRDKSMRQRDAIEYMMEDGIEYVTIPDDARDLED